MLPRAARSQAASAIQLQTVTFLLPESGSSALRKIGGEPSKTPYTRPARRLSARDVVFTLLDEKLSDQETLQKLNYEKPEDHTLVPYTAPTTGPLRRQSTLIACEPTTQSGSKVWSSGATAGTASTVQSTPSSSSADLAKGFGALQISSSSLGSSSVNTEQWWNVDMGDEVGEDDGGSPEPSEMETTATSP